MRSSPLRLLKMRYRMVQVQQQNTMRGETVICFHVKLIMFKPGAYKAYKVNIEHG